MLVLDWLEVWFVEEGLHPVCDLAGEELHYFEHDGHVLINVDDFLSFDELPHESLPHVLFV